MQSIYVCIGKSVKVQTEFKEHLLNSLLIEDAILRLGINLYTIYKYQIHSIQYRHIRLVGSYMVLQNSQLLHTCTYTHLHVILFLYSAEGAEICMA